MPDLEVGKTYTLTELSQMIGGGGAMVPSDRIVTTDLAWERMTVGRLVEWLTTAIEAGEITDESEVWVDSDPEGNGIHPVRASASLAALMDDVGGERRIFDEDATEVAIPAPAVWLGVGY